MTAPTPAPLLTKNDRRVLEEIERACGEWDAFVPRGPGDWTAVRRLKRAGLAASGEICVCQVCPERHDVPGFVMTDAGKRVLHPEEIDT